MSRCVEKPFAPLLAVWLYQGVSPWCPTARLRHGASVFPVTGGRYFCRSKPNAAPP